MFGWWPKEKLPKHPIEENRLEKLDQTLSEKLEKVTVKSAKNIMADLTDSVLDIMLQKLAEKEPKIAKLLTISEFKDIKIKAAEFDGERIKLFFKFPNCPVNTHQLLVKNGYNKNDVVTVKDGIVIYLYDSNLTIDIRTVDNKNS